MSKLLEPVQLGEFSLPNRNVMAPLTRCPASAGRVPNEMMRDYYVQRASAGLIISEATSVMPMGVGYPDTPGIWSKEQIEGWLKITRAVQAAGGRMLLQLWHVGRISHPIYLNGALSLAPARSRRMATSACCGPKNSIPFRALALEEIAGVVEAFRQGAENARVAGFDGLEIHRASGLPAGSVPAGRLEQAHGSVGRRNRKSWAGCCSKSPTPSSASGTPDASASILRRAATRIRWATQILRQPLIMSRSLGERKIAFFCARERAGPDALGSQLKKEFGSAYVVNEDFTPQSAEEAIERGEANAVAWAKPSSPIPIWWRGFAGARR